MNKKDESRVQWQDGVGNIRIRVGEEAQADSNGPFRYAGRQADPSGPFRYESAVAVNISFASFIRYPPFPLQPIKLLLINAA